MKNAMATHMLNSIDVYFTYVHEMKAYEITT